ncbi:hypothetical protein LTR17_023057 [Elasticomyces elasticus]|nr:hypothetical protein LTR17_023057 [Elasticomyces elasticus]
MAKDPRCLNSSLLSFTEERIKLVVGSEKREFHVARQPLEEGSEYFRLALRKDWQEGQSKVITLEDVTSEIVHLYLHFVYTGKIATLKEGEGDGNSGAVQPDNSSSDSDSDDEDGSDDSSDEEVDDVESRNATKITTMAASTTPSGDDSEKARQNTIMSLRDGYNILAQLYCFGERVQNEHFKNTVIDAFMAKLETACYEKCDGHWIEFYKSVRPSVVQDIYEGTPPGSPARKLMVSIYTSSCSACWILDALHRDFLLDLSRKFCELGREGRVLPAAIETDRCDFHSHASPRSVDRRRENEERRLALTERCPRMGAGQQGILAVSEKPATMTEWYHVALHCKPRPDRRRCIYM